MTESFGKGFKRAALFFDVDGTLIDDRTKVLPESAVNAIAKARENGHLVFINSGRVRCMLDGIAESIQTDGLLCGCGTQIILEDRTICEHRIERERGIRLKESLKSFGIEAVLEASQGAYLPARPFKYPDIMERVYSVISKFSPVYLDSYDRHDYDFDKFCIFPGAYEDNDVLKGFFDTVSDFDIIDRGDGFYEFVPEGCSKGSALEYILDYFDISPENAYVFGDSMNDLTMFTSRAGNRILMGEHDTRLDGYATFIADKVMDDGIYKAMKEMYLL